jgi:uncharacterized protein (TIGR00159 family)
MHENDLPQESILSGGRISVRPSRSSHERRESVRIADILDILVISVFLYFCILWVRQRSSRSVIVGVSAVAALYVAARVLNMHLTSLLFQVGFTALMVAFVVVFQMDIRRVFERLTARGVFRSDTAALSAANLIDTLVEAAFAMAESRTGALIVVKGREPLDLHVRAGMPLDGFVNLPLLLSIFSTDSPGHDGAVVIEEDRIKAFGVYLPLSTRATRVGTGGTRHAAALGLAERSDALVVVVSEERGVVSIAHQGQLYPLRTPDHLRRALNDFHASNAVSQPAHRFRFITNNLVTKIASVMVAAVLWFSLAYRTQAITRNVEVPVGYRNLPADWEVSEVSPDHVRLTLSGIQRSFDLEHSAMMVRLDLGTLVEGSQTMQIVESSILRPPGLSVKQISPALVTISAHRISRLTLPVHPLTNGVPPKGKKVVKIRTEPETVGVTVRYSMRDSLKAIPTKPIQLSGISSDTSFAAEIVLPKYASLPPESAPGVRVVVDIEKKK